MENHTVPLLLLNRRPLFIQRDISDISGLTPDGPLNSLFKYT